MRASSMGGADTTTLTQADLTEVQRSESLEASADVSRRLFPSYIAKAYRCMLSHVIVRFSNVIHTEELALWKAVLMDTAGVPTGQNDERGGLSNAAGAPTMFALAMEDLVLRLACRKPQWFAVARLQNSYADLLASYANRDDDVDAAVAGDHERTLYQVVDALCQRPIAHRHAPHGDAVGAEFAETMLLRVGGGDLVDAIAHGDDATATDMLQCIRRAELKDLAIHLRRHALRATSEGPRASDAVVVDRRLGSGSKAASGTKLAAASSAAAIIPDAKGAMIAYILKYAAGDASLAEAWDATVGTMVRVHPKLKLAVQQLLCWFHIATEYAPSASSSASTAATPPLPASNIAVLATLGRLRLPMQGILPSFALQDDDGDGGGMLMADCSRGDGGSYATVDGGERLLLFADRMELDLFVEGLRLRCELFEACEGFARYKMRDAAFARDAVQRVEAAMQQLHSMAKARHAHDAAHAHRIEHSTTCGRKRRRADDEAERDDQQPPAGASAVFARWLTVPHALYRYGYDAYHLTRFLPLYQWMHCAEYLCDVLQAQRQYDKANQFLRILLDHPVFELHADMRSTSPGATSSRARSSGGSVAVVAMCYRYQARGKWWHRLGQNMCQLGQQAQALRLMEQTLEACCNATADDGESNRIAERLERIMHGRWDRERCLRTASTEVLHKKFLRRADRMTMERLQVRLHKPPRRWGKLPSNLLVATVRTAPLLYINGHQDLLAGGWNDEALSKTSCRVESHVLRWFERGRGRRESGWRGAHCEGSWVAALTEVVFLEAFVWHPAVDQAAHEGALAPFVWLTPFQERPLDCNHLADFSRHRAPIIRRCIDALRSLSQAAFVEFVTERTTLANIAQDDGEDGAEADGDGDEDAPQHIPNIEGATASPNIDDAPVASSRPLASGEARAAIEVDDGSSNGDDEHEEVLLFEDEDGDAHEGGHALLDESNNVDQGIPSATSLQQKQPPRHTRSPPLSSSYRVSIAHIPQLREMAACIPIPALCSLFETMFLSHPAEGHMLRFSGWPDLAVWRLRQLPPASTEGGSGGVPVHTLAPQFKLVEVKSPSDKLSDKQIAVNDLLLRSGFDVCVACVVNNTVIAATKAPRTRLVSRYTPDIAPVQMTRRTSSSFVRGSATNPVLL